MKKNRKSPQKAALTTSAVFKKQGLYAAVLLTLGPALGTPASAQSYVNYDGSSAADASAALATWTGHAEFKADWGLGAMNAQYAYVAGYTGQGIKLGAVDSGLLLTHNEFARRNVKALAVTGNYANDGYQYQDGSQAWKAGDAFSVPGALSPLNDKHGSHVSGTIAAAKNGDGIMGVAFASDYYITNTNGTDSSVYGVNMDYNYFKAAYGNLASAGVRAINSSWGNPDSRDDFGSISGVAAAYQRLQGGGKKSWLDAAADVAQASNTLLVWAAGNASKANVNIRSALPYFRPELEQNWIAVAALNTSSMLPSFSNQCGLAKYWCVSAPGSGITSLNITSDTALVNASGTSMAAPHVTGALGVLMQRYPDLDNQAIRTILLSTAKHLGTGAADVPNTMFGWGLPDLNKALYGPGQLLGVFKANIAAGSTDTWSNDISEAALVQRKSEDKAQLAAWQALSASTLQSAVDSASAQVKAQVDSGYDAALALVQTRAQLNAAYQASNKREDKTAFQNADKAVAANALAAAILKQSGSGALLSKDQLLAYMLTVDSGVAAANLALGNYNGQAVYLAAAQKKTDADYVGSLVKTGDGSLTLSGNNSYTGGTRLEGGTLGVGSSTALGTGGLAMSDGVTLRAAADNLALNNAVSISGAGRIDTQAFNLTLNNGIADGRAPGSLVKQGEGTLRVLGTVSYSGNTTIAAGTLSLPTYVQTAGQILTVGVASATQYGKLAVTGAASFASGAALAVDVAKAATLGNGQKLAGVITAGSLSAPRLAVSDNSVLFDFQPVVASNAVDLDIVSAVSINKVVLDTLAQAQGPANTATSSTPVASAPAPNTPAASTPVVSVPVSNTPAASTPVASAPASGTPASSTAAPSASAAPAVAPAVAPAARSPSVVAAATAAATVAPILDRQIQQPSSADMAQVVTALGRLPDAASVLRAASQTLPRNVSDNAIRGVLASLDRVIATRLDLGNLAGSATGTGSGLGYGEAGGDRQVWLMPFESRTNQGDRDGDSGFSASTWGMATGAEMALDSGRVGLSYAYASTSASGNTAIAGAGSRSRIESNLVALYGSVPLGKLALSWQADAGWNSNRLAREMQFGGLNRIASSRYHTWSAHLGANVSHTLPLSEALSVVPALQLDYTRLQSPSYAESGAGDLSLSVQGKRTQALLLGVGTRLNYALSTTSQISTHVGASYDVINDRGDLVATYAGTPGQAFTAPGSARSAWLFKAGVSYRFQLTTEADISLRLDAEGRSGFINQSAALKANWRF
ncbi:autotransporter domain-containing protein [Herbaspirillum seropedicae]|uniref:S8 family serine peptidase n=1 Tax=Herbaspirillum seropedicae TaxID=964 RepID=UPI0011234C22|nr:S8 family serine peptidase [Herbaspirillum seropedicae]QDD65490.1 autotransporter domain-containing protein [Herbaspirillum seropedicae]